MILIAWTALGLIAGTLAKIVYPNSQGGAISGIILLGIAGALVGGILFDLLQTGFFILTTNSLSFSSIAVAVTGAIIVISLYNIFTGKIYS